MSGAKKNTTLEYLETAEPGVIIAFRTVIKGESKTLSGKLISHAHETPVGMSGVVIETRNGSIFNINADDVIWVKTGERWPRWVFEELKKK